MGRLEANGRYFDGRSSAVQVAKLTFSGSEFELTLSDGRRIVAASTTVKISSRVGSIPRSLTFPDGGRFETSENDTVDGICQALGSKGLAFRLESSRNIAYACAAALLCFLLFSYFVILPASAERLAFLVSPSMAKQIAAGSKKSLDSLYFKESALAGEDAKRLASAIRRSREAFPHLRLDFQSRQGHLLGANAFALPDNTIYVTDELVELAGTEEEVMAVIFHEIGHVHFRHSLIQMIQDSSISLIFFVLIGGDWINLPVLLVGNSYSRDHERAADDFAMAELRARGIESARFAEILEKMSKSNGESSPLSFLSTHPLTEERSRRLRAGNSSTPTTPAKK